MGLEIKININFYFLFLLKRMTDVNTQDALSAIKSPVDIEKPYSVIRNGINISEIISYLIMLSLFVVIITTNQTVFQDLSGNPSLVNASVVKNNNVMIQILCGFGILLCLIRICWANIFVKNTLTSHIMELVFGLLVWGLFITLLILSLRTKEELDKLDQTEPVVKNAKKHNQTEHILSIIGIGLSSLYTVYNIYVLIVS